MEKLLEIKNLNVGFLMGNGQIQVLNQVSLDICENEVLAVVGETGCGKSVTGSAILHLLPENAVIKGEIYYKNQEILKLTEEEFRKLRGKEIGSVPQSSVSSLDPMMRIGEQVAECVTGGELILTWTSDAPASFSSFTILPLVVPRTMESSMRSMLRFRIRSRTGISFILAMRFRLD